MLNGNENSFTGHVAAYLGEAHYNKQRTECHLRIGDCARTIELHPEDIDQLKPFVKKLRKLAKETTMFADWLEKHRC